MLEEVDSRIFDDRGDLAVVVQHAYHLAALHAQPAIRGALARLKLPARRQEALSHVGVIARGQARTVELVGMLTPGKARCTRVMGPKSRHTRVHNVAKLEIIRLRHATSYQRSDLGLPSRYTRIVHVLPVLVCP